MTASPSSPASPPGAPHGPQGGADPSMEDILASIRRILSEDEAEATAVAPSAAPSGPDVLPLDPSMLVEEPPTVVAHEPPPPPPVPPPLMTHAPAETPSAGAPPAPPKPAPSPSGLLGPEAVAAASSSMGSLLRTLAERQTVAVRSGGPSIEDLVREELRALLKVWLDTHLPPLVERLVRAEIERVVGRALS